MRRHRLRGDGGDRRRAASPISKTPSTPMCVMSTRCAPIRHGPTTYARMQPVFDKLYVHSQALYDDLDALAVGAAGETSRRAALHGE